jgi:hypothetical protein
MILMHRTGTNSGTYFLIVTQSLKEPFEIALENKSPLFDLEKRSRTRFAVDNF